MNDCCENCRFWEKFTIQPREGRIIGECLRRSPRVFQGEDGRLHTKFPTTRTDKWCGEHEASERSEVGGRKSAGEALYGKEA